MDDERGLEDVMLGKEKTQEAQQDSEFISLHAMDGKSCGRQDNKPTPRLHVRKNNGNVFTFMYHQLDSHATFTDRQVASPVYICP